MYKKDFCVFEEDIQYIHYEYKIHMNHSADPVLLNGRQSVALL